MFPSAQLDALELVKNPLMPWSQGLPLMTILQEAVREIVRKAPEMGLNQATPHIDALAHLLRVLIVAYGNGEGEARVVGFLRIELMDLTSLMKDNPGDPASACRRLGSVFAQALEVMGRDKDETYPVPDVFRVLHFKG